MKKLFIIIFALTSAYAGQNYSMNQVMVDLHDYKKPVFFCFDKDTYNNNVSNSELKQFQAYIREYVKYNFSFHLENHNKPWQNIAYTQHGLQYVMVCELRIRFSVHAVLTLYYQDQGKNDLRWEQIYSVNFTTQESEWVKTTAKSLAQKVFCPDSPYPRHGNLNKELKKVEEKTKRLEDIIKQQQKIIEKIITGNIGIVKKYDSGWFPAKNFKTYSRNHSLNAIPDIVQLWYSDTPNGSGDVTVTGTSNYGACDTTIAKIDNKSINVSTGKYMACYRDQNGKYRYPSSGYLKITAILIE